MEYFKDEEFRFYLFVVIASTLIISGFLWFTPGISDPISHADYFHSLHTSFRYALFQVVTIFTSTGFATADYCTWPTVTGVLLFVLMFVGSCGGSTSGGMKCVRIMLMAKHSISEIKRCLFPRMVSAIHLNETRIEMSTIHKTLGFVFLFFGLYFLFVLILPLACPSMDYNTAVSASVACMSNIGPGFGQVGPSFTYSWMTPAAKALLSFQMLLGRLELYTVLVLFLPSFWRK